MNVQARASGISFQGNGNAVAIDASGASGGGAVFLTAGTVVSPASVATLPPAMVVTASPSSATCDCSSADEVLVDLAAFPPQDPKATLLGVIATLGSVQGDYPGFDSDLQIIIDKIQEALTDEMGVERFVDTCHVLPAPDGEQVFYELARAVLGIQRLVPWNEMYVDPEGEPLPPPPAAVAPESLRRILEDQLTYILQTAALLADVTIQEARGEPGGAAAVSAADVSYLGGLGDIGSGLFLSAVDDFRNAWLTANAVLPVPTPPIGDPPIVSITTPGGDVDVGLTSLIVTGMVQDIVAGTVNDDDVSVLANGVTASVVNGSFLASAVPTRIGISAIVAVATDIDGNRATFCRFVRVDPTLTLQLQEISGNNQTGEIQSTLPLPLVVQLNDDNGNPVENEAVVFRVVQGNGGLGVNADRSQVVMTNPSGQAQASFTLGSRVGVGVDRVRARAVGFAGEVVFCTQTTGLPPDSINVVSGSNQRGEIGAPLAQPLIVVVTDAGQNPGRGCSGDLRCDRGWWGRRRCDERRRHDQ